MDRKVVLVCWEIHSAPWDLKCTARYNGPVSQDQARIKMEKLYERICKRFQSSKVSLFYSTEKNEDEGHHITNWRFHILWLIYNYDRLTALNEFNWFLSGQFIVHSVLQRIFLQIIFH
jgi:hypothetical protein